MFNLCMMLRLMYYLILYAKIFISRFVIQFWDLNSIVRNLEIGYFRIGGDWTDFFVFESWVPSVRGGITFSVGVRFS